MKIKVNKRFLKTLGLKKYEIAGKTYESRVGLLLMSTLGALNQKSHNFFLYTIMS